MNGYIGITEDQLGRQTKPQQEMVTDLRYCTTTMTLQALTMSPVLTTAFQQMSPVLQRVASMTIVFKFCKRPRTRSDNPHDDYSPLARMYMNILRDRGFELNGDPFDLVGLKCAYCHNSQATHVPGSVSLFALRANCPKGTLTSCLQHRANHLYSCRAANSVQPMPPLVYVPPAYSHLVVATSRMFDDEWIRCIEQAPFDQMPIYPGHVNIQLDTYYTLRLGQRFWEGSVARLLNEYEVDLDYLEKTLFCPDLALEVHNEKGEMKPLPASASVEKNEMWMPLQCRHIAQYRNDAGLFRGITLAETYVSSSRGEQRHESAESMNVKALRLHAKANIHDVVVPTGGCTRDLVRTIYNLRGHRRFMRLISEHRKKYLSLRNREEKNKLAKDIIVDIEQRRGGVFRTTTYRKGVDAAVALKIMFRGEILAYCRLRLEKGFPDVLNICPQLDDSFLAFRTQGNQMLVKVAKMETAAAVGVLHGHLVWEGNKDEGTLEEIQRNNIMIHSNTL